MIVKQIPTIAVYDDDGCLDSIAVLDEKAREVVMYSVIRKDFEGVSHFLERLATPSSEKRL